MVGMVVDIDGGYGLWILMVAVDIDSGGGY